MKLVAKLWRLKPGPESPDDSYNPKIKLYVSSTYILQNEFKHFQPYIIKRFTKLYDFGITENLGSV